MIYSIIYLVSFIMYPLILIAMPDVTAQTWADAVALVFVAAVCYELVYIFHLRKKDNVSLKRAIALYFLYLFSSVEVYIFLYYADNFINGFATSDFLGNPTSEVMYGFEAIVKDTWAHMVFVPILVICVVYQIVYFVVRKKTSL